MRRYQGDYDSAAWLASQLPLHWSDPARGQVPLGWGLDPNLAARMPQVFPWVYGSLTANDTVITGDSGAGYLNPTNLYGPQRCVLPPPLVHDCPERQPV